MLEKLLLLEFKDEVLAFGAYNLFLELYLLFSEDTSAIVLPWKTALWDWKFAELQVDISN